jgi:holo-[acyl-carrier protein] synthase
MVIGVGIDLVEVERIRSSWQRFGERFARRILCPAELEYCLSFTHPETHLAARFAAKEAISKALGTGIGQQLGWQDMEVLRRDTGQPEAVIHGPARQLLAGRGVQRILLSLTHTCRYAAAVAILDSEAPREPGSPPGP